MTIEPPFPLWNSDSVGRMLERWATHKIFRRMKNQKKITIERTAQRRCLELTSILLCGHYRYRCHSGRIYWCWD
jgi:hypothetical protein